MKKAIREVIAGLRMRSTELYNEVPEYRAKGKYVTAGRKEGMAMGYNIAANWLQMALSKYDEEEE